MAVTKLANVPVDLFYCEAAPAPFFGTTFAQTPEDFLSTMTNTVRVLSFSHGLSRKKA